MAKKDTFQLREERNKLMLEAPVYQVVPIIALPMVIQMLIDSFYNLADTYFVSTLGTFATAAVGVNNSLMTFLRAIGMGFGIGASSYMSRLLGAKKYDDASRTASTAFFSSMIAASIMALIIFIFREKFVVLLGATQNSKQYSIDYATFILLSAPFTIANTVLSQALRAEGSTTFSMIGMVSGCFVNLALDPLFIFVFKWGVAGAAAATGISKVVSFCILLTPYLTNRTISHIGIKYFSPSSEIYTEIGKMGIPSFFRTSLMSVASVLTNNYAGSYGDSVLAAASVSNRIMMFMSSMVLGFGQGFQPIAGYCWGAKKYKRVRDAFWVTTAYGALICLVVGTTLYIYAPQVIGLFTKTDQTIIDVGVFMVRILCVTLPAHVWVMIINSIFQAIGRPISAAVLGLSRQGICLIPSVIILNVLFGLEGLKRAQATADILSMCIALPMLIMFLKEINQKVKETEPYAN